MNNEIHNDTNPDSIVRRRVEAHSSFSASNDAIIEIEYNRQNAPSIMELKKQKSLRPRLTLTEKENTKNRNITLTTRTGITGNISMLLTHAALTTKTGRSTPETL